MLGDACIQCAPVAYLLRSCSKVHNRCPGTGPRRYPSPAPLPPKPRTQNRERALICGTYRTSREREATALTLEEMALLAKSAGAEIVDVIAQERKKPDVATYFGSGKVAELKELVTAKDVTIVMVDAELSPVQARNLEKELEVKVLDRTELILDIFAQRARSREGRLQVELAQLQYNLARMRGLWTHLERLGGGIGTRGPGESQIETDQRLARNRISALSRRLETVSGSRATMRAERRRNRMPTVALAGYTNSGKSSLMNALTGADVIVRDRLFETLDPTTRSMQIDGRQFLLTDTVGFIRKLPHQLVRAFGATLEETLTADVALHVFDASVPDDQLSAMLSAVEEALGTFGESDQRRILVANKIDLADAARRQEIRLSYPGALQVSALTGEGIDPLRDSIAAAFAGEFEPVELLVPYTDGETVAEVHRAAGSVERENREDGVLLRASLPHHVARRLSGYAVAAPVG